MPPSVSNQSSVAGPSTFTADGDACDPSAMSCAAVGDAQAGASVAGITLDPVLVAGDLGTRELVETFAGTPAKPDCKVEELSAALSCGTAAATAVWAVASAPIVIGLVGGAAATFMAGANCGKDLALVNACKQPK